jgi:hypothetical protein
MILQFFSRHSGVFLRAIGTVINVAARLCGQILITHAAAAVGDRGSSDLFAM